MTSSAAPRSTARPRRLSLLALAACLLLALTGSLALGERAAAGNPATISVSAHQSSYTGVDTVHVSVQILSFTLSHNGTCDLAMTKLGRGAIGKVTIFKVGQYFPQSQAFCNFDIPRSNLSSGYWMIRVRFQSDADDIDVMGYDSIYVA